MVVYYKEVLKSFALRRSTSSSVMVVSCFRVKCFFFCVFYLRHCWLQWWIPNGSAQHVIGGGTFRDVYSKNEIVQTTNLISILSSSFQTDILLKIIHFQQLGFFISKCFSQYPQNPISFERQKERNNPGLKFQCKLAVFGAVFCRSQNWILRDEQRWFSANFFLIKLRFFLTQLQFFKIYFRSSKCDNVVEPRCYHMNCYLKFNFSVQKPYFCFFFTKRFENWKIFCKFSNICPIG